MYYTLRQVNAPGRQHDAVGERRIFNRLQVLRAERALSRQDLANALGINYQTIGYIERGDFSPGLELVFRISEFFNLPVEAIFSRQPFRPLSEAVYGRATKESTHAR